MVMPSRPSSQLMAAPTGVAMAAIIAAPTVTVRPGEPAHDHNAAYDDDDERIQNDTHVTLSL
jgi:hypothetical protein